MIATDPEEPGTVLDGFSAIAERHPDGIAIGTADGGLRIGELDVLTNRLANTIPPSPDRRPVAVMCRDEIEFQAAQLGVLKAGRPLLAVHPDLPATRRALVFAEAGVDTVIISGGQAPDEGIAGREVISMDRLSGDDASLAPDQRPEDLAYLMYTSGSTAAPKAIAHSYRSLHARSAGFARALGVTADDRVALIGRLTTLETFSSFLTGAAIVPFDLRAHGLGGFAEWMASRRITLFRSPPSVFRPAAALVGSTRFPELRLVVQGGEAFTPHDVELFNSVFEPHTELVHIYGSAEAGLVTAGRVGRSFTPSSGVVPAGPPVREAHVTLETPEGSPVPPGEEGMIVVQSPALAIGYLDSEGLTDQRFRGSGQDRRFLTGDRGRWDGNGHLEVLGRDDGQVKVGGHRFQIGEVEGPVRSLDGIDEAVVVPRPDADGSIMLVAYYTHGDPAPRVADFRRALALTLPGHMIPSRWVPVDAFSHDTSAEKIDRQALPDPPPGTDSLPGEASVNGRMAAIWGDLLGVRHPADTDSFFGLGGDSLAAAALVAAVEQGFECRLEMADLFADDTFGAMCTVAGFRQGERSRGPLFAIKRSGDLPPLYCIHQPGWSRLRYVALSRAIGERRPMIGVRAGKVPTDPGPASLRRIARRTARAIRAASDGPYFMLGHSAAGLVAYEAARLLARDGGWVAFVGVIDAEFPGLAESAPGSPRQTARRRGPIGSFLRGRDRVLQRLGRSRRPARPSPPPARLPGKRKRLRQIHDLHRVIPFEGPVTYFRAAGGGRHITRLRQWRRLGVRVVTVPGEHKAVLKAENVEEFAAVLESAIAEATRGGSAASRDG